MERIRVFRFGVKPQQSVQGVQPTPEYFTQTKTCGAQRRATKRIGVCKRTACAAFVTKLIAIASAMTAMSPISAVYGYGGGD